MKIRRVVDLVVGLTFLFALWAGWHVGAAREAFVIRGRGGDCKLECIAKKRWFKTGTYGGWIFSDSEPEWVADDIWVDFENRRYPLPEKLARRFATPQNLEIAMHPDRKDFDLLVTGGDGAGYCRLSLKFASEGLVKAEIETVASLTPSQVYP